MINDVDYNVLIIPGTEKGLTTSTSREISCHYLRTRVHHVEAISHPTHWAERQGTNHTRFHLSGLNKEGQTKSLPLLLRM